MFYYLIDLHYSQTVSLLVTLACEFYYLIDLHYSQTIEDITRSGDIVLLPYRFTLFSNRNRQQAYAYLVLLPYRFTLFSN